MSDVLRVLTSLYSWAGAVVHGTTEDGHDVIELCDGTRVETSSFSGDLWGARVSGYGWITRPVTRTEHLHRVASVAVIRLAGARIRDLLTGPPEDA